VIKYEMIDSKAMDAISRIHEKLQTASYNFISMAGLIPDS